MQATTVWAPSGRHEGHAPAGPVACLFRRTWPTLLNSTNPKGLGTRAILVASTIPVRQSGRWGTPALGDTQKRSATGLIPNRALDRPLRINVDG